jgi:hypothetical protein
MIFWGSMEFGGKVKCLAGKAPCHFIPELAERDGVIRGRKSWESVDGCRPIYLEATFKEHELT